LDEALRRENLIWDASVSTRKQEKMKEMHKRTGCSTKSAM
jgi:hypothetical protein